MQNSISRYLSNVYLDGFIIILLIFFFFSNDYVYNYIGYDNRINLH